MATIIFFFAGLLSMHMHVPFSVGYPSTAKFPAILVFGDSTADTGNNNYIPTVVKANFFPYGINFDNHTATGRFSDGSLVADIISGMVGIKDSIPPFLNPKLADGDVLTGVSFASAGSGLDEWTVAISMVLPMSKQVEIFESYITRLRRIASDDGAKIVVNGALIMISAATNDFVNNYYNFPIRRAEFDIHGYQDFLLQKMENLIEDIYDLGGRRMLVAGLAPVGCLPIQKNNIEHACVAVQNADAIVYNSKLQKLLVDVQTRLSGSKLAYFDAYNPILDMINDPKKYGFEVASRGCCGSGMAEMGILCGPATAICEEPSKFVFWDSIHPSEAAYQVLAESAMNKSIPLLL